MLIGYRCKVCGAPIDPETEYCRYCDTLNFEPIKKPTRDAKPKLTLRHGGKEAEINPLKFFLTLDEMEQLEITSLEDTKRRFILPMRIEQFARFEITTFFNSDMMEILKEPVFEAVFEGFYKGYGHSFDAYAKNVQINFLETGEKAMARFDVVSYRPVDFWNKRKIYTPILEVMRCPICGAPLDPEKPKCDYCGYWWLYSPER